MKRLVVALLLIGRASARSGIEEDEGSKGLANATMAQQEQLAGSQTVDDGSPLVRRPEAVVIQTDLPSWINEPPWWWLTPPWWIATPPLWSAAAKHTDVSADGVGRRERRQPAGGRLAARARGACALADGRRAVNLRTSCASPAGAAVERAARHRVGDESRARLGLSLDRGRQPQRGGGASRATAIAHRYNLWRSSILCRRQRERERAAGGSSV